MGTSYKSVNRWFLRKVTDSWLSSLSDRELAYECYGYMLSAIAKFGKCRTDLSARGKYGFDNKLTEQEIEILAGYMAIEWLTPQVNSLELTKIRMTSRDFRMSSQANHLEALSKRLNAATVEVERLLTNYTHEPRGGA